MEDIREALSWRRVVFLFVVKNFNLENALNFNLVAEIIVNEFLRKKKRTTISCQSRFLRGSDFANESPLSSIRFAEPLPSVRVPRHPTVLIIRVPP